MIQARKRTMKVGGRGSRSNDKQAAKTKQKPKKRERRKGQWICLASKNHQQRQTGASAEKNSTICSGAQTAQPAKKTKQQVRERGQEREVKREVKRERSRERSREVKREREREGVCV